MAFNTDSLFRVWSLARMAACIAVRAGQYKLADLFSG
jgi:hypothetical protein